MKKLFDKKEVICYIALGLTGVLGLGIGCIMEDDDKQSKNEVVVQQEVKEETKPVEEEKPAAIKNYEDPQTVSMSNSDFKKIANDRLDHEDMLKFFNNNTNNYLEFNGAIDAIDFVPNMKTRVTMLLRTGNYDKESCKGPTIYVENVAANDPGVKEAFKNGDAEVGNNIRCKVRIKQYNEDHDRLEVELVELSKR